MSGPDLAGVQGLFARGFGELAAASFLLLAVEDAAAARRWLGALPLTALDRRPEERAVNVAVTGGGLLRLGLAEQHVEQFSREFVDGMAARSRVLGDVGRDAPEHWEWGGASARVDLLLLLYATDDEEMARLRADPAVAPPAGVAIVRELGTSDLQGFEPFGFRDGISQPFVEGLSRTGPPGTNLRLGEFVLGYPNEYGRLTDRPLLDRGLDPQGLLPADPEGSGRADLGRNGTYLVLRQLSQDVRGFWRYLDGAAGGDPARRVRIAAKMVGRWPGGAPLALAPDADDPALARANDFGYFKDDRDGLRCPLGAHVRRTNPRDSLDPKPGTAKSLEINRRHRILRRGREYGPPLPPDDALGEEQPWEEDRGLHFICLNANLSRQFEFLQATWVNNPKFAGLADDADPLTGPSQPYGGTFTIQADPLRERLLDVPRFVTLLGGAYFFLPGLAAVRYLATL